MRHFIDIGDLERHDLESLLDEADGFVEVLERPIPKVPALRGKTVTTAFFEPSTRTRLSFETLAELGGEIIDALPGIVSVTYNIAPKPPSTIEAV